MTDDLPPWEAPFVVQVEKVTPERRANVGPICDPRSETPRPAVVLVHGGPRRRVCPSRRAIGRCTRATVRWPPAPESSVSSSTIRCTPAPTTGVPLPGWHRQSSRCELMSGSTAAGCGVGVLGRWAATHPAAPRTAVVAALPRGQLSRARFASSTRTAERVRAGRRVGLGDSPPVCPHAPGGKGRRSPKG